MTPHVDIVEMYFTACKFSDCADFCMRVQQERETLSYFYTDPGIVNAAFSCEVFLKLLLYLEQINYKKEHRLKQLFEMLPPKIQEAVKHKTTEKCGYWNDVWGREILLQISDAFIKWRYIYETDWSKNAAIHIDISYLFAFRDALKVMCEKKLEHKAGPNGVL